MAKRLAIEDITGALGRFGVDESAQIEFGASAPGKPLSIDGATLKDTDNKLGIEVAPSEGCDRVTGFSTLPSGIVNPTFIVTHSLGRLALFQHEMKVGTVECFIQTHSTTSVTVRTLDGAVLASPVNVNWSYL